MSMPGTCVTSRPVEVADLREYTQADIVFREELDEIAAGERPRLSVVHVLAKEDWRAERACQPHRDRRSGGRDPSDTIYLGPPP